MITDLLQVARLGIWFVFQVIAFVVFVTFSTLGLKHDS